MVAHVAPFQAQNVWREKKAFSSWIKGVHLSVYTFSQMVKRMNSYMVSLNQRKASSLNYSVCITGYSNKFLTIRRKVKTLLGDLYEWQ